MSIAECAAGWFGSERPGRFDILGIEHLNAAVALGHGVIAYTGHFTTLEIMGQSFRGLAPRFAAMASHRSSPLLEEIQTRGRMRMADEMISSASVRSLLKALKKGSVIWYAPDLAYPDGVLVPFFNVPAMTNTATSKIARMSGAAVLPFSYRRLERGARYEDPFLSAARRISERRSGRGHAPSHPLSRAVHPRLPRAVPLDSKALQVATAGASRSLRESAAVVAPAPSAL